MTKFASPNRRKSKMEPDAPLFHAPTADTVGFRRIIVLRHEMTCIVCGDVTTANYCMRCGDVTKSGEIKASNSQLVPTLSYLNVGEYQEK